jgi:hypothetical protein
MEQATQQNTNEVEEVDVKLVELMKIYGLRS